MSSDNENIKVTETTEENADRETETLQDQQPTQEEPTQGQSEPAPVKEMGTFESLQSQVRALVTKERLEDRSKEEAAADYEEVLRVRDLVLNFCNELVFDVKLKIESLESSLRPQPKIG